jgi:hypothetical protein
VAAGPNVVVQDCRMLDLGSTLEPVMNARQAGNLFLVRGMQLLARGEEKEAVDHLLTALGLSRLLRHKAVPISFQNGLDLEKRVLKTLTDWLTDGLRHREVVARVVEELEKHEAGLSPLADAVKAEYLTVQRTLSNPRMLAMYLELPRENQTSSAVHASGELALTAVQMPWEKARQERLLNCLFAGTLRAAELPPEQWPSQSAPLPGTQNPWMPATKGPDAGLTAERLAKLLWPSLVQNLAPSLRSTFARYQDSLGGVRLVRGLAAQVLGDMRK